MGRILSSALLTGCALMPAVALGMASRGQADRQAEIARLVKQLGSDDYDRREQAERRLVEIGSAAVPALRAVLDDPDPEVRLRAGRAYRKLTTLAPGTAKQLREEGRQAFGRGDYESMARAYAQLARTLDARPADCALPFTPMLIPLSPQAPTITLDMSSPTRGQAFISH